MKVELTYTGLLKFVWEQEWSTGIKLLASLYVTIKYPWTLIETRFIWWYVGGLEKAGKISSEVSGKILDELINTENGGLVKDLQTVNKYLVG